MISSIGGLFMSIAINKVFPKNIAIAENKTPIKGKSTILDKSSPKKEEKKEDIKEEMPKEEAMNVDKNEIKDDEKNNDSQSVKYVVGKDIQKGVYKLYASGDVGSYKITDKKNTDTSETMFFNFSYISLKEGQTLDLTSSTLVAKDDLTPYNETNYVDGQYKVGYDIEAGTYNIKPLSGVGKVEVYSDLTSGKPDLTSYVDAASKIQLRDNQYITITNVEMSK